MMRRMQASLALLLVIGATVMFFTLESGSGELGAKSFVGANLLGFGAVVIGVLAAILLLGRRARPP